MSMITRMRRQYAVYWTPNGVDGYGKPTYEPPVELRCRWDEDVVEFVSMDGDRQLSNAKVYPDRDLLVGGLLKQGRLDIVTNFLDPRQEDDVFEIRQVQKIPNLKATEYLRIALL